MAVALALAFLLSIFLATVFVLRAELPPLSRGILAVGIIGFALLAFFWAPLSPISPFAREQGLGFGTAALLDITPGIIVGVVGSFTGVMGSYFFNLGRKRISIRNIIPPVCAAPLVLIPTVKLIESSTDQTALGFLLLFGLSYQNGFFWERLLAK